jgi:hypothetical protein
MYEEGLGVVVVHVVVVIDIYLQQLYSFGPEGLLVRFGYP